MMKPGAKAVRDGAAPADPLRDEEPPPKKEKCDERL